MGDRWAHMLDERRLSGQLYACISELTGRTKRVDVLVVTLDYCRCDDDLEKPRTLLKKVPAEEKIGIDMLGNVGKHELGR